MKKFVLPIVALLFGFSVVTVYQYRNNDLTVKAIYFVKNLRQSISGKNSISIDNTSLTNFFKKYPYLDKYQSEVTTLYKKRNYKSIWYDDGQLIEFADLLYSKSEQIENEGLKFDLAYKEKIDAIFNDQSAAKISQNDKELLLSTLYVYYVKKVFYGIDTDKIHQTGWFLPRKELSYKNLLDSLLAEPELLDKNEKVLISQYYKLRAALQKYRQIEKNDNWKPIDAESQIKKYSPGDSAKTIAQIRHHLFVLGDLTQDSKNNVYDDELKTGILNFKTRNGYKPDYLIGSQHINRLNQPIEKYIQTIKVNMERCRWLSPELEKSEEFIIINIPSFQLFYIKNGRNVLSSRVFVGINMMETVIFSSTISSVVFSPYWNVPQSILENEIKPAMEKDPDYLIKHNLEWNKKSLRQKPGPKNALGVVKFVFPNTYSIYLHDTPYKLNFNYEFPRFSHGCINMQKAKELAYKILENNPQWPVEKINEAMNSGVETVYPLKKPIPIHIGYFTSWVNDDGKINFYFDIYTKDDLLAEFLFNNTRNFEKTTPVKRLSN
ncbi:L,D-transpeptidase family protein [Flavobacterium granuli]|uniref:Murein L,D-transpeptidase YcbB/YkuD n=1 Tax=Flavobacterium granuli TaxID=280093 RepID=A0A1M5TDJ2_9FLAO|nr:L,D-transpeptidase family protein [Flavobacterium granuli]PRZ20328.1 murein L,D-transpeptidase YcbB/YkuD [Flavobacterium granuli]SHH48789.1 Murein L,D-transpeptidase YcbB/YkuD [Flavobacterium granuli]